ncbi:MAG: cytochrome c-type biogenesis protein CcmH [Stagnimonas sp.]|nr:cytochrome c-type biogenesis protein CcmH [Stagnimonas sp.]
MKRLLVLLMFWAVAVQAQTPGLDAAQEVRYHQLINELRCLVCQNQTIAESTAPLALDLKEQVRKQLSEGKSNTEITRYLTDRYGDFVLYRPPFKANTLLLWAGPFVLLLAALIWAVRFMRGSRKPAAPPRPVDEAAVQKLLAETRAALAAQDEQKP